MKWSVPSRCKHPTTHSLITNNVLKHTRSSCRSISKIHSGTDLLVWHCLSGLVGLSMAPAFDHDAVVIVDVVFALFSFLCVHFSSVRSVKMWIVRRQANFVAMQNEKPNSTHTHTSTVAHTLRLTHAHIKRHFGWQNREWWVGSPLCLQNPHLFLAYSNIFYACTHPKSIRTAQRDAEIERKIAWKFVSALRLLSLKWISLQ